MNLEHDGITYQLYLSNDYYVHLDRDDSTLFISNNNLKSCLTCTKLSKNERAFFQNIILYGSFYEVLHRAGICQYFDDVEMSLLNAFMYASLNHHCIAYNCLQLQNKLSARMKGVNNTPLFQLKTDTINISEEMKCIYLQFNSNAIFRFDYGKYIDESNKNYFIYNLIWVLIHYYYPTEHSFLIYEDFITTMNEYSYPTELKNQILKAFGDTNDIQKSFQLSLQELWDYLFKLFDSDTAQLPREEGESRSLLLKAIDLKTKVLVDLNNLIK